MIATKITLNNRNFIIVPESDWKKIATAPTATARARKQRNGVERTRRAILPPLPEADRKGNRPAMAFADAAIARSIIQRRKRLGLSQVGLAHLAGIRVEVLNRAERAVTIPSVRTLMKIEAVLGHLERRTAAKQR